jgi:hypothetical protein
MDTTQILNNWPSVATLAADMDVSIHTAQKWRTRGRIPSRHWDKLLKKAAQRKYPVQAADLIAAHCQ